jgi:hypothetical protein
MNLPTPAKSCARRVLSSAAAAAVALIAWPHGASAQPKLSPIIERASEYVANFIARFSNIVAEERYIQQTDRPRRRRELLSDYLFVKPAGQDEWFEFRDVISVDGNAVAGREQRMIDLFVNPANLRQRLHAVAEENSRHNLEDIGTIDTPLLTLSFLQPIYVERFAYTTGTREKNLGPRVRVVQFREIARPSILRADTRDLPAHGLYWIDEDTGRVVKATLDFRTAFVTTTFRYDPDLETDVPAEMKQQWYLGRTATTQFTATSTYGRFRRFGVQTEEKIR